MGEEAYEEGSGAWEVIHIASIVCLVGSRMWLGSDCHTRLRSYQQSPPAAAASMLSSVVVVLLSFLGAFFVVVVFLFLPRKQTSALHFVTLLTLRRYQAA